VATTNDGDGSLMDRTDKERTDIQIKKLILQTAVTACGKLKIMGVVHLTHEQASIFLDQLVHEGLIDYNGSTKLFHKTHHGTIWMYGTK